MDHQHFHTLPLERTQKKDSFLFIYIYGIFCRSLELAACCLLAFFWTVYERQIIINCIDHVMELEQDCRHISAGAIYATTAGVNRPRRAAAGQQGQSCPG